MDYKEKYEQGLECIQEILSSGQEKIKMTLLKERLLPFFPELKESEDERIRKMIINHLTQERGSLSNDEAAEAIAWLEKQGEQKPTDKVEPKFKVGDIVKFDRPSAMLKREILNIDFENERYLTRRTDIGGAIKEFIYFCEQDDYVIVGSHNNLSIEVKVSILADEIIALKQRVKALEIQAIRQTSDLKRLDALEKLAKDSEIKIDALECGGKPF